jgi:hypothetical protein
MNNYKFTFETERDYLNATITRSYIESFDIVRVVVEYSDKCTVDFPIKSREEFEKYITDSTTDSDRFGKITKVYQAEHSYDIHDYL